LGAAILLVFALVGDGLLGALSIGLPAFRTAGGILPFLLALDMIFGGPTGLRSRTVRDQEEDEYNQDISVFPLAIPLLAGPGAITTVLLYTGGGSIRQIAFFVCVLLVVLLLTLASLLLAPRIVRLFGETSANVLSRVLGILLAALRRAVHHRRHPVQLRVKKTSAGRCTIYTLFHGARTYSSGRRADVSAVEVPGVGAHPA
jgi:multiple antibiotic resistance protein